MIRTSHTLRTAAAALVAAVLAGLLTWVITRPPDPLTADQARDRLQAGATTTIPGRAVPSASVTPLVTATASPPPEVPDEPPVSVTLASLGLTLPILGVGLAADGQMELPPNPSEVGWYRFGPSPTTTEGAVVLAAHVDSRTYGAGPLARLGAIVPGSTITVATATRTVSYTVTDVISVLKSELDLDLVFDRSGPPRLHLVTCGGEYVRGQGWSSNVTVVATRNA